MKSIRLKLWTSLMFFVGFMLVVLWLFQIVFLDKFYTSMHMNQIREKGAELITSIEKSGMQKDSVMEAMDTFAYMYNLNLEVIDTNFAVLYQSMTSSSQQSPNMFKKTMAQVGEQALLGNVIETSLVHPRFNTTNLVIGFPIFEGDDSTVIGSMILVAPLPPVADTADILKSQLVYISMLLILVAFIIAWVISKQLSKPILQIEKAAKKIAKGEWEVTLTNKNKDEIGQLSVAIQEMAEELKRTDLLRKELIGNISHELRTPLSLIKGYAETIRDLTGNIPEKRERQLDIIIRESDRLSGLISDILNLSQLETGAIKSIIVPFDLKELLLGMQSRFDNLARQREITLDIRPFKSMKVLGDVSQIEQVLVNLLSNAFQHSKDKTTISIRIEETLKDIKVIVEDEGSGIPEEYLSSIWDRYYKISNKAGEESRGSGLGLSIVKNILKNHNAEYGVESTVDIGTKIWFTLSKE